MTCHQTKIYLCPDFRARQKMAAHNDDSTPFFDSSYEAVTIYQAPQTQRWVLPMLYNISATGVVYEWQIGFDGQCLRRRFCTQKAPQYSSTQVETNNSGKSLNQQAYQDALTHYRNKVHEGYQLPGATEVAMVTGMKGHWYKPGSIKKYPVMLSVKLNGVRALVRHEGGDKLKILSYKNRSFDHLELVAQQVRQLIPYLPPFCTLDGEMYCHGVPFHEITSAVKTNTTVHPRVSEMVYHVFDIYYEENPPTESRYLLLKQVFETAQAHGLLLPNLTLVQQWYARSHEEIMSGRDAAIQAGYEGVVIRRCGHGSLPGSLDYRMSQYFFGRSNRIFKLKDHFDEEGEVVGVEDCKGKDKGKAKLLVRDRLGHTIPIRWGNDDERRAWMSNPALVMGKQFTFRHVGRHPKTQIAQQPTGVAFRDYE